MKPASAQDPEGVAVAAEEAGGKPASAPWHVYLIECIDGSIYTGVAIDVAARYAAHAAGKGARYTRSHPPLRLIASLPCPDRSSALQAEYRVKQLRPAAKRAYAQQLALALAADGAASG